MTSIRRESDGTKPSAAADAAKKLNINRSEHKFGNVGTVSLQLALPPTLVFLFLLLAGLMSVIWAARLGEMKDMALRETNLTAFSLATRLENTTNVRIVSLISQWYEANFKAFTVVSDTFKAGVVGRSDFDKLYWLLLATVKANPTMTGLVLADPERNSFIAISRMDNGSYTFELQSTPTSGLTCTICPTLSIPATEKWYYLIDESTNRPFATPYLRANYSMTARPWYTTPMSANKTIWSDFYRRSNGLTGQMNLGEPLFSAGNASGVAWGVLSLEASAQPISDFLKAGVADAPDTTAYVMDTKFKLMGTSANESVLVDQMQVAAVNSTNPFTRFTAFTVVSALTSNEPNTKLIRTSQYWFKYSQYDGQADAHATIVAGTPTASYLGALDRVQVGFESSFTQSIRDAALIAVGFALLCAALTVAGLHKTVIRPLKDVCREMVMATKFEFQALTDGAHKMKPSRVQELNKVQYSFRALVAEFASGIKVSRSLSVTSAKRGAGGEPGAGSSMVGSTVGMVSAAARNLNGSPRSIVELNVPSLHDLHGKWSTVLWRGTVNRYVHIF